MWRAVFLLILINIDYKNQDAQRYQTQNSESNVCYQLPTFLTVREPFVLTAMLTVAAVMMVMVFAVTAVTTSIATTASTASVAAMMVVMMMVALLSVVVAVTHFLIFAFFCSHDDIFYTFLWIGQPDGYSRAKVIIFAKSPK